MAEREECDRKHSEHDAGITTGVVPKGTELRVENSADADNSLGGLHLSRAPEMECQLITGV